MQAKIHPSAIVAAYTAIIESEVFRNNGPAIDLPTALIELGNAVHENETDEFIWSSLGEHTEAPLGDLIVGAYWSLTEWHAGQYSPEYAALCALGQVFSPGMTSPPKPEDGGAELAAYELCNAWFESRTR